MQKTVTRSDDLTTHICSNCLRPINGSYIERIVNGCRLFYHVVRCDPSAREQHYDKTQEKD